MASRVLGVKDLSYNAKLTFEPGSGTSAEQEVVYLVKMEDGLGQPKYDASPTEVESILRGYGVRIGTKSVDYKGIYISELSYEETANGLWEVTATYNDPARDSDEGGGDEKNPGGNGNPGSDDPWSQPPTITWGMEYESTVKLTDAEKHPLVNSYGDTFEGGVEFPFSIPTLSVRFSEAPGAIVPQSWQRAYVGTVNKEKYLGWKPGQVLCRALNITKNVNKGRTYYDIEFELAFKAWEVNMAVYADDFKPPKDGGAIRLTKSYRKLQVGWHKVLADVGYRYIDDSLGNTDTPILEKTVAFKDSDGNPFIGFLDGFGGKHPMYNSGGERIVPGGNDAATLPRFIVYNEYPFSNFFSKIPAIIA